MYFNTALYTLICSHMLLKYYEILFHTLKYSKILLDLLDYSYILLYTLIYFDIILLYNFMCSIYFY